MDSVPRVENNSIRNQTKSKVQKQNYEVLPDTMKAIEKKKRKTIASWFFNVPEDVTDIMPYLLKRVDDITQYIILPKLREILISAFTSVVNGDISKRSSEQGRIPKVSYNYNNIGPTSINQPIGKKDYVMYEDIYLATEEAVMKFKDLITGLFDDQGGYISVAQYMNCARRPTFPDQFNFGWKSLNGFDYRWTTDGFLVKMPYPVPLDT